MQCLNKFCISTSLSLNNSPNSHSKSPSFQPRIRTHEPCRNRCEIDSEIASKKPIPLPPNVKTITSPSNPFVKHCVKLRQSPSYRHFHDSVLLVGATPIRETYSFHKSVPERPLIQCLFVLENCCIPEEIDDETIRIIQVNPEVIRKISGVQSVDCVEVIALLRTPSTFQTLRDEDCPTLRLFPRRLLVLDGIQDPGNLGTLVRSATAFRWDGVFLLPGCCDPFNDKALRASRAACFQIPILSGNWKHVRGLGRMKMLAGHPATSNGTNLVHELSKDFADSLADSPVCLVLGSEGAGLSEYSRSACELVTIPMAGEFESLNVSVAGGIFMYMLQPHNSKSY